MKFIIQPHISRRTDVLWFKLLVENKDGTFKIISDSYVSKEEVKQVAKKYKENIDLINSEYEEFTL